MIKTNVFFDFTDFQAKFGPPVPDTPGIVGHVILASPPSACEPLTNDDGCVCFQYLCVLLTRPDEIFNFFARPLNFFLKQQTVQKRHCGGGKRGLLFQPQSRARTKGRGGGGNRDQLQPREKFVHA